MKPEQIETPRTPEAVITEYTNELRATTLSTAAIFGLSGLDIAVNPGAGWSTIRTATGILLTIDPLQVAHKPEDAVLETGDTAAIVEAIAKTNRDHTNYAICHELGHAGDMIEGDPLYEEGNTPSKSDHFFWNILDDAVINTRMRRVPVLDACTDELYREVLFPVDDLRDKPQHVQLMYGLLLDTVIGGTPELSDNIRQTIAELKVVQARGASFNIMHALASTTTSLSERRQIGQRYIKPHYDALLEEDQQQDPQSGNVDYEDYEHVMHNGRAENDQSHESDQPDRSSDSQDAPVHDSPIRNVIQETCAILQQDAGSQAQDQSSSKSGSEPSDSYRQPQPFAPYPSENNSSKANTSAERDEYRSIALAHRAAIIAVAQAFQELAVPSVNTVSPRYTNRAIYDGSLLHSGHLVEAALELETGRPQAIWRSVGLRGKQQDFNLSKLDFHLLADGSLSMNGETAEAAAATAIMIMEGLEFARYNLAKLHKRRQKPDVRTQMIAFDETTRVLAPLSHSPSQAERLRTFRILKNPWGRTTNVADALRLVNAAATQFPDRHQLVFIVSDGAFHDYNIAHKIAENLTSQKSHRTRQTHIAQFLIQSPNIQTITKHVSHISTPQNVPIAVRNQLALFTRLLG